jgi:aryl-alcohol dehydrogenase-like predicted oxidoreductase
MYQGRYWSDEMFRVVETLVSISQEEQMAPAQVSLAWVLHQNVVTSAIVGASRPEQLRENVKALDKKLSAESIRLLDEASLNFV